MPEEHVQDKLLTLLEFEEIEDQYKQIVKAYEKTF